VDDNDDKALLLHVIFLLIRCNGSILLQ